ncbi:hypothetical protein JXJ21_11725 [candidate division KSB1 bacterium]|nr:hypothetical protein [candidate division KSB1 bacterium]
MKSLHEYKNKRSVRMLFLLAMIAFCFSTSMSVAAVPRIMTFSSAVEFEKGKCQNIAIGYNGHLFLAPKTRLIFDSGEPFLWSFAGDADDNMVVGSGNDGKVFKIDPKGNSSVFFDAEELEVYALAFGPNKALFVGTSPDGKIYRVDASGKSQIYFDPPDKYIWDLVFDDKGNLFAATGDSGIIYKITSQNKGSVFFDCDETHIRTLKFDPKGNLLGGSVGNGFLYQISPTGKAFVLFDAPFREIHTIDQAKDGTIYIGALGTETPSYPAKLAAPGPEPEKDEPGSDEQEAELIEIRIEPDKAPALRRRKEKSAVYKLTPEGAVQNIWEFKSEIVYSLVLDSDGTLIIGTGDQGKIFRLTPEGKETLLFTRDESQVTALHRDRENRIYLCSSNMGRLAQLNSRFESTGSYESDVIGVGNIAQWGSISWKADVPGGTGLELYTRSGNTSKADETWSTWSAAYEQQEGENITSPASRYLQWKLVLKSDKGGLSPKLKELSIAYLERNLAPSILEIVVKVPDQPVALRDFDDEEDLRVRSSNSRQIRRPSTSKNGSNDGMYNISWYAEDDNADELTFDIYYKDEAEPTWKLLKDDLKKNRYALNGQQLPDGTYLVKVVASDAPSNPVNFARKAEKISDPFMIDNTGPEVDQFRVKQLDNRHVQVNCLVTDAMHPVQKVEFVFDVGDWQLIYPVDQICDSKKENFTIESETLPPGKHTIVIRAYDRLMNIGFGKFQFEVK